MDWQTARSSRHHLDLVDVVVEDYLGEMLDRVRSPAPEQVQQQPDGSSLEDIPLEHAIADMMSREVASGPNPLAEASTVAAVMCSAQAQVLKLSEYSEDGGDICNASLDAFPDQGQSFGWAPLCDRLSSWTGQ